MAESTAKKSTHAGARIGFHEQYFNSLLDALAVDFKTRLNENTAISMIATQTSISTNEFTGYAHDTRLYVGLLLRLIRKAVISLGFYKTQRKLLLGSALLLTSSLITRVLLTSNTFYNK